MRRHVFCPRCQLVTALAESEEGDVSQLKCVGCGGPLELRFGGAGAAPLRPATILCVDDDRLLLGMFSDALEEQGYRTLIATDGPSGIEAAKKGCPDLIVLDVMMPGMTGIEVCRRLRAKPDLQNTPILLLTAMQDLTIEAEGRVAGATLTVRKPLGPALIVSIIHELLGRKIEPEPMFKG
jgi:CheY-like chemotaxis protein